MYLHCTLQTLFFNQKRSSDRYYYSSSSMDIRQETIPITFRATPKTEMDGEQESALKEINLDQIRYIKEESYTEVYIKKEEPSSSSEAEIDDNDGDQESSERVCVNQLSFKEASLQVKGDQVNFIKDEHSGEGYTLVTVLPATGMPKGDTGLLAATQSSVRDAVMIESGQDRVSEDNKSCEEDSEINDESSQPDSEEEEFTSHTEHDDNNGDQESSQRVHVNQFSFKETSFRVRGDQIPRQKETHQCSPAEQQTCIDKRTVEKGRCFKAETGESGSDVHDGNKEVRKDAHLKRNTGEKPHQCYYCSKWFPNKGQLTEHVNKIHTGERPHCCPHCIMKFSNKTVLNMHMNKRHTGEHLPACSLCQMKYATLREKRRHMKKYHGKISYKCSHCKKIYYHSSGLESHIRNVHMAGEKPYLCSQCGMRFILKSQLARHMIRHTSDIYQECSYCSKKFSRKGSFVKHIQAHTREKSYSCRHCSEIFPAQCGLIIHRRMHAGQTIKKIHECCYCSQHFFYRSLLVEHLRKHTGEKPYPCAQCDKRYIRKSTLHNHMKTHQAEVHVHV